MAQNKHLPCPYCDEREAQIDVRMWGIEDGTELYCQSCGTEFGVADVEAFIAEWQAMLPRIKAFLAD